MWDLNDGKIVKTFRGHTGPIDGVRFASEGQRIVSSGPDGLKIWNVQTGELLASFLLDENDWIVITPEGFFAGSPDGAKMLSIIQGLEVYSIDQFFNALNRPDLVREKLAGDPRGLVRDAAARLDLTKVMASGAAPLVTIASPTAGISSSTDEVTIEASIVDHGGGIGRIEWRVNATTLGVEERGLARNESPSARSETVRIGRRLPLEPGDNVIELVAYNSKNLIASDPARVVVKWDGSNAATPPTLHVIAVGVNDYWDSRLKLSYAVPDAQAVSDALRQAGGALYKAVEVTQVLNSDVTVSNLDKVFAEVGKKVHPRDVFVFFLAGHGKTVDGKYYFLPSDFRYETEDSIAKRGVDQDRFQNWFARIAARKSILLYDTCESGSLTGERVALRGLERVTALEKMTRAMGRTVLSASTDDTPALEGYRGHGVFTYAFLEAMGSGDANGNGLIEVTEIASHIDQRVPDLSFAAFKQRQVPQMKIVGSNFPVTSKHAILSTAPEARPTAGPAVVRPTHVVIQPVEVLEQPKSTASVSKLAPGTLVTLVKSEQGWVLVAKDGKSLGYVASHALAPIQ